MSESQRRTPRAMSVERRYLHLQPMTPEQREESEAEQRMLDDGCPNVQERTQDIWALSKAERGGRSLYHSDVPDELLKVGHKRETKNGSKGFWSAARRLAAMIF